MAPRGSTEPDLEEVKSVLSARVLRVRGVSGIGVPDGKLTVYLEYDSTELREEVLDVVKEVTPGRACRFIVTGKFVKQG